MKLPKEVEVFSDDPCWVAECPKCSKTFDDLMGLFQGTRQSVETHVPTLRGRHRCQPAHRHHLLNELA